MNEMFTPPKKQRYIFRKTDPKTKQVKYLCVPEIIASKKKKSNSKNGLLVKKATVDNLFEEGDQVSNYIGASKEETEDCDDCEGIDSCDNENADCDDKEPILGRDPENDNQSKRLAKRRRYRKSNTDATLGCDASEF